MKRTEKNIEMVTVKVCVVRLNLSIAHEESTLNNT